MTPEMRSTLSIARLTHYFSIVRTTFFLFVAIAAILILGPQEFSLALAMLVVATTAFGILAGNTALEDIENLRADLSPEVADTNYGKGIKSRNMPMFKALSAGLIGLTGLAQLLAILF
ncbi:hypothetical protein FGK63_14845 [Ruegeria sediminis]|uniref:Heme o synthase n=1 Tax=Ruegeria sediminis TaxID=2583820 RepID=A0ABY2WVV5_9RHOB|nr:hypothetical protein [Ruegeria sediminis]TMV06422.1 hypothetical protein FGK63_14845 [Ruegeria sediminis]